MFKSNWNWKYNKLFRKQSIDSIETYAHGMSKVLICKKKILNALA